jgi:hypothetical protein
MPYQKVEVFPGITSVEQWQGMREKIKQEKVKQENRRAGD